MRKGCTIIKIDEATAIMCGGEQKDYKCNEDKFVLILENGDKINDTPKNQIKYKKEIKGGSVACSICGRAAIDSVVKGDYFYV